MASLSEPDTGVTAGAATQMTDAEVDTVTAGAASLQEICPPTSVGADSPGTGTPATAITRVATEALTS